VRQLLDANGSRRSLPVLASRLRKVAWELRTEGAGPAREAWAIGLGVLIGCSPLYGFHLLLCWAAGWCLGLNRLKMYLAANISNPIAAPLLILTELQAGAWTRRGHFHPLSLESVRNIDPWSFGADLIVGSFVVGAVLGAAAGLITYLTAKSGPHDPCFLEVARAAADRYAKTSMTAWEFARGKLRGDPVYRTVLASDALPDGGTLVDVGCGQGLMLALFAESAAAARDHRWPRTCPRPAVFDQLIGIESRPRAASLARRALGDDAIIIAGDAREHIPSGSRVVLFFDVLHMIPAASQDRLLAATMTAMDAGGVIFVREPDAGAGWRFALVEAGNRLKALATGNWRQTFHFRTAEEWTACFERLGYIARRQSTSGGTPFANVLFVLERRPEMSTSARPGEPRSGPA
jgi:uncharacterized protein (DUF2062 family)